MKGERPRMIAGICARLQPGTNSTGQECAAGRTITSTGYRCMPDAVDPRGPKAK